MSTDPAHSLGDSFDVELSGEPKKLSANLHAIEIDVHTEMKKGWKGYNTYLSKLLSAQGIEEVMAKEMVFSSGLDELSGIMKIKEFHDEKKYDVLIIDCAPTGETMRWLNFPNAMEWYMRRIYGVHRKVLKVARPTVRFSEEA